ncbi:type III ribulose-bisphosphate carboxylase [Candidatus Pyrohabitans sp.]
MGYLDLSYKPGEDEVICKFYVEPSDDTTLEEVLDQLPAESSIGTWTDVATMEPSIVESLAAHTFRVEGNVVYVSYPYEAFEHRNISQILSSIAGNIFGVKVIKHLRLLDVSFPKRLLRHYPGPAFGIEGIRGLLRVQDRPLLGTIIKPKMGLSPEKHALVAFNAWIGGCDIVKDDENLTDQGFNPFKKRVVLTLEKREKAERETGERKVYMANITAPTIDEMFERLEFVKDNGGEYVMLDVVIAGFTAVQTLRSKNPGVVLHAHRAMHAALTRNPKHGIHMAVLSKVYRMLGMDQLHIGTIVGKMESPRRDVLACRDILTLKKVPETPYTLGQEWGDIKPTFPVASGGLHPGHVPALIEAFGRDVIIQMGGGVHGHPGGTIAGARAARAAIDAVVEGVPLAEHKSRELQEALEKFSKS